jgi:CarD family transcriptional regulator
MQEQTLKLGKAVGIAMFKLGDHIMYNSQYLCVVDDICDLDIGDESATYYVLRPIYERATTIKIPVDSTKVSMRRLISSEKAQDIIKSIPDVEPEWIEDKNVRASTHRKALRSGCCEEWAKLLCTLHLRKQEVAQNGKKLSASDEQVLRAAALLLHGELSVVLDMPIEDVESTIAEELESRVS